MPARLALCGAWLALTGAASSAAGAARAALPQMPAPRAGDRILVIAPHPDDETLCCGGYLQRAAAAGASTAVVWMTAGDSFEIDAIVTERTLRPKGSGLEKLGAQRIAEAHAAADRLGVPRAQQYLLGFPDRDLRLLLRAPAGGAPLRSRYTGASAVPYAEALHPGSAYTGAALRSNLQEVIARFAPTIVLAAAPQDRHPDHSASGALATELARSGTARAQVYYWIVHGGHDWPEPRGLHRERPSRPPRSAHNLAWERLPLDDTQVAGKLAALGEHHTQLRVMRRFLEAFVRSDEIYAPAP
ncbi:MAG: PIG-L family deacetylase [Gammaproteobacteria bacterium]|nr:PIG-L family deacetylase [Gammaproteobacteria bacterium]MDE2250998.1 PIG-L family deacetylase [Gammaproteobacteria bacterium]